MNLTGIEWTTFSANPLKYHDAAGKDVWGCVKTSPGCARCYSEAIAQRYRRGGPFTAPIMAALTPFLDEVECRKMRTAKVIGGIPVSGSRCFIGDMTDIFGEWVPDDLLNELFSNVLEVRTDVTWQILTKRAARAHDYLSWRLGEGRIPSRHIHIGVSVENQHFADERIPLLLQTPAAVRFISAEPLLGPIDFTLRGDSIQYWDEDWRYNVLSGEEWAGPRDDNPERSQHLDWVIVGGESGTGARPFEVAWARSIVRQCKAAGVACFVKQFGANVRDRNDAGFEGDTPRSWPMDTDVRDYPNGYREDYQGAPVRVMLSKKGGDLSEWPEDLRVREFPR